MVYVPTAFRPNQGNAQQPQQPQQAQQAQQPQQQVYRPQQQTYQPAPPPQQRHQQHQQHRQQVGNPSARASTYIPQQPTAPTYVPQQSVSTTAAYDAPVAAATAVPDEPSAPVMAATAPGVVPIAASTPPMIHAPHATSNESAYSPIKTESVEPSLPDFSQALSCPSPPRSRNRIEPTAPSPLPLKPPMPLPTTVGEPVVKPPSSVTYTGGPTNGVISEGNPTQCHKVDYEIKGHEMQLVELVLDPQETVIAEAGAMMFLDDGIDFKAKFGDGSNPKQGFFGKLMAAGGRILSGESLFLTHFTNQGHSPARVAFAAPFPGSLLPINMAQYDRTLICQKDSFLCAAFGTKLSMHFNKRIGSGFFGGEGFILQKLEGDGMAFIHAGGTVIRRELRGERLRVDTGCVVAFTQGINFDIQLVPGLKSIFFGGEGLFLATLQGTGTVWMQSLPFSRMADRILQHAPSAGGGRQGEGTALTGGFGDFLDGDNGGFEFNL